MQIAAKLGYWDKKPAIILKASVPRSANNNKRYNIFLDQIWLYSEDHYEQATPDMPPTYEHYMLAKCLELYDLFDLGTPNSRQLAELAWLIQDSIDQLKGMPPEPPPKKVAIGEAKMQIDGNQVEAEIKI